MSNKLKTICEAMEIAGYSYNEFDSSDYCLVFNCFSGRMTFSDEEEALEWLNGVVLDDPAAMDQIDRLLNPCKYTGVRTYYKPEYDVRGETGEILYGQAKAGYISDPEILDWLSTVLEEEKRFDLSEKVAYLAEDARESGKPFSVGRIKFDLSNGYYNIEDFKLSDDCTVSMMYDQHKKILVVSLSEYKDGISRYGSSSIQWYEFKKLDHDGFENFLNSVYFYSMQEEAV